jgi:hypothetical protein
MITLIFEYRCDFCEREIVGRDVHHHGADYGRFPVPRGIARVGSAHACKECAEVAVKAALLFRDAGRKE